MRRKFSIGVGCQLCRILWVRTHRKSCLGWKGDKNPGAGFYLRKAGRPNLPENLALDNGPCSRNGISESGITSTAVAGCQRGLPLHREAGSRLYR